MSTQLARLSLTLAGAFLAVLTTGSGNNALAQQNQDSAREAMLEEIVVTSRRYEESIQDAPLAVNVMNAQYLVDQQVFNTTDAFELTPSVTWSQFAKVQSNFEIRGIPGQLQGNATLEAGLGFVMDGIPATRSFMAMPTIFDMERLEVMRGPQGTTFGRNAAIGLMHFISARPSQEFESAFTLQAGTLDLRGLTGFVSGPLSDTVSARIAVNARDVHGPTEDWDTGEYLMGESNRAIRGSILYEPNEMFTAYVKAEVSNDDDLAPARTPYTCTLPWVANVDSGPPPSFLHSDAFQETVQGPCSKHPWGTKTSRVKPLGGYVETREITNLTAELTWNLQNDLTVTSLTGFIEGEHYSVQDTRGTPFVIEDEFVWNIGHTFSTELRLDNSAAGDRVTWLAGVYLMNDEEDRAERVEVCPQRGGFCNKNPLQPESVFDRQGIGTTDHFGLFAEVSFDITERLNFTIGGRYSDDKRDYWYRADGWGLADEVSALGFGGPRSCLDNIEENPYAAHPEWDGMEFCGSPDNPMGFDWTKVSRGWDNFSTRASATFALNDNHNLYLLYSEGYKAGGFQNDAPNEEFLNKAIAENEEVQNWELGWKATYDRARFAVTAFSVTQQDAQNSAFIGTNFAGLRVRGVYNYVGVDTEGLEFEGEFLLGDNFTLGGNFALLDAVFADGTFDSSQYDLQTGEVVCTARSGFCEDLSGLEATGVPSETFVIYGEYEWQLAGGSTMSLRADVQHRGESWATSNLDDRQDVAPDGSGDPLYQRPQVDNVGAQVRWISANGNSTITLWGKNITEEVDYVFGGGTFVPGGIYYWDDGSAVPGNGTGVRNRPVGPIGREQWGLDYTYRF